MVFFFDFLMELQRELNEERVISFFKEERGGA